MTQPYWQLAEAIARELVNREVDVNEFQKVITYVRIQATKPEGKAGEGFFSLLDTMVRDGRYLMRSGRTMDYYRNLQSVCKQHLTGYRTATGEQGQELVEILGWAARLMRYYNTDAGDAELVARQNQRIGSQQPIEQPTQTAPAASGKPPKEKAKAEPKKPPIEPEVTREAVTLLTLAAGRKARVRTEAGEEISCVNLPAYPLGQPGEVCEADVTRENGRAVRAVFQKWK